MKANTTNLTPDEAIKTVLARFPAVHETPVRNVAHWLSGNRLHNSLNLRQAALVHGWKGDLFKAIKLVLKLQGKL